MDVKIPKIIKYIFFIHIAIFLLVIATEPNLNSIVNSIRAAYEYPLNTRAYYPVVISIVILYSVYYHREVNK